MKIYLNGIYYYYYYYYNHHLSVKLCVNSVSFYLLLFQDQPVIYIPPVNRRMDPLWGLLGSRYAPIG
jgi:hypothetical protein